MPKVLTALEKAERRANEGLAKLLKARGVGAREKTLNELLEAVRDYQSALDAERAEDE